MSNFRIINPEETINLFTDPRFGAADPDTAYDISGDGGTPDVTRVTTDRWAGTGCASFDLDGGTTTLLALNVTATVSSYTISAMVKRAGGGIVTNSQCQARIGPSIDDWDSITERENGWWYCIRTAIPPVGLRTFGIEALEDGLLVDAIQLENKAYATTYADGDLIGHRDLAGGGIFGYRWDNGNANASTSTRHAEERSGGRIRDLVDDLSGIRVDWPTGIEMPSPLHQVTPFAISPGGTRDFTKLNPRIFDVPLIFEGAGAASLQLRRLQFKDLIKLDLVHPEQPFTLQFTRDEKTIELDCYYQGGLEGNALESFRVEKSVMRLLSENPYWRGIQDNAAALAGSASVTASRILRTTGAGLWEVLGTGANGIVKAIVETSTDIFIGGDFTTAGGVTVNHVARWNKSLSTWNALGPGGTKGTNDDVRALAVSNDENTLFIGGDFTAAGGTAFNYFVQYDIAGDTFSGVGEAEPVLNFIVLGLVVDSNDKVYAVGAFTTGKAAGGGAITLNRIGIFDPASTGWLNITDGTIGLDAIGWAIDIDGDILYIGGEFETFGTVTVNRIAKYTIATDTIEALASGINQDAYSITVGNSGVIFAGTTVASGGAGGVTVVGLIKWNGTSFEDMDVGQGAEITQAVAWDADNQRLYLGGSFTEAVGDIDVDLVAYWDGNNFRDLEVDLKSISGTVWAIEKRNESIVFGFNDSGSVLLPATTTVTNEGMSKAYPTLEIAGPDDVVSITNVRTGAKIEFTAQSSSGILLGSNEILKVVLEPGRREIFSNFRSSSILMPNVTRDSDWSNWALLPGTNDISIQIDSTTTSRFLVWRNRHEDVDGIRSLDT